MEATVNTDYAYQSFIRNHLEQMNSIPNRYWRTLFKKLSDEIFDVGEYLSLMKDEKGVWHVMITVEDGLQQDDENSIFLIDHAWTYEVAYAKPQLQQHPNLLKRMMNLMDIDEDTETEDAIEQVLVKMWKYNKCYHRKESILTQEKENQTQHDRDSDYIPLWYIMDEVGSRVAHSDSPNFIFQAFYFMDQRLTFTLMFPNQDLEYGDEVSRDYQNIYTDAKLREIMLYPWDKSRVDLDNVEDNWVEKFIKQLDAENEEKESNGATITEVRTTPPFKVFSTNQYSKYITNENFEVVEEKEEADIIYEEGHYHEIDELLHEGRQYILEHQNKKIIVCKDLLAETCIRHTVEKYRGKEMPAHVKERRGPIWLPTTFNLVFELPQFIKHYKEREARNQYNIWIVKPWNLARSLGIEVCDNLEKIIRLNETGPRIVCEYISDISLFPRENIGKVKWEIRHFAFVKSVKPLEVFVHNLPYVRFANKNFELKDLHDFQKHFTNMYYRHRDQMLVFPWKEFYPDHYNKALPKVPYKKLESEIFKMIKELFEAATTHPPPLGLGRSEQCRGYYAIDMILRWRNKEHTELQPMLLECNFIPCMTRALEDDPELINDMFGAFFLDQPPERMIRI